MSDYHYDNQTVKGFIVSSIFGVWSGYSSGSGSLSRCGSLSGISRPSSPLETEGCTHQRSCLRPGIGAIFGISYYIVMNLPRGPCCFLNWPVFISICSMCHSLAAVSLFAGMNQSLEYAELEWPLDIVVVILWVIFAVNVFGTIIKRKRTDVRIALYIIATVIAVAVLYIVNNLSIPAGLFKSYHLFAGVNSANVECGTVIMRLGLYSPPHTRHVLLFPPQIHRDPHLQPQALDYRLLVPDFAYLWTGLTISYTPSS